MILGGPAGPQDASCAQSLQRELRRLKLEDVVSIEPPVPITTLPLWYGRCAVYANLTPTGSGDKVTLEAMACARPCLVANEGFRDTLGEYAENLLFRYGDAEDLACQLEQLLAAPAQERQQIGSYLSEQVIKMHSLEGLAGKLCTVFEQLVRGGVSV